VVPSRILAIPLTIIYRFSDPNIPVVVDIDSGGIKKKWRFCVEFYAAVERCVELVV
jgi:hypothetical protein